MGQVTILGTRHGKFQSVPFCILELCQLVVKYTKFDHDRAYSFLRAGTLKIGVLIHIEPDSYNTCSSEQVSMMEY